MKIFKIGLGGFVPRFLLHWVKKVGELWSTNHGDLAVKSYPPKSTFSENHILAPRRCCAPKLLHTLENDKVLLAYSPSGMGVPYKFFQMGVQNWLKI